MKIEVHNTKEKDMYVLMIEELEIVLERSQARELIMKLDNKIIP